MSVRLESAQRTTQRDCKPRWVHSPASSEPLQERAKARKSAADADAKYPPFLSIEAVVSIIASIDLPGRRGKKAIPDKLDLPQLRRDLNRALWWFVNWKSLSRSQPWAAHGIRGTQLIRSARSSPDGQTFFDLWNRTDLAGNWWREQVQPYRSHGQSLQVIERIIRRLMAERLTQQRPNRWKKQRFIERPATWLLEPGGPESPMGWLTGDHLVVIFRRHFPKWSAAARQYQSVRKSGEIVPGKVSPYVALALAVLESAGIKNPRARPYKIHTIVTYRKDKARRKKAKQARL
ncbi:hypothetical protein [Phyllobacterium sp. UNC302MFCol5.2]|uniref:hypothetical protein n=1 Tax=Phyllobacterium sp. UNC302MFCol5.2 TaxID=1449065 RepID=UPI0004844AC7|nr:hypothetical protein [Phyllobacterium sp. UNC302MFCol5.2]